MPKKKLYKGMEPEEVIAGIKELRDLSLNTLSMVMKEECKKFGKKTGKKPKLSGTYALARLLDQFTELLYKSELRKEDGALGESSRVVFEFKEWENKIKKATKK